MPDLHCALYILRPQGVKRLVKRLHKFDTVGMPDEGRQPSLPVYSYIAFVSAEMGSTLCRTRKTRIIKDRETVIPMEPPAEIGQ